MKPITFDKVCYRIDGKPVYLNSGEFHYFRVPKADWRRRMDLFAEAGGNCIATYIPWLIHEPEEGRFVFGGDDGVYDLEGFLRVANEAGLYVVARPGPYQYSELIHAGLPAWLVSNYPNLMAKRLSGKNIGPYSISYTHPLLLAKTQTWYQQVCPLLKGHLVSAGGCIPFVQIDNELTGVHLWYYGPDYNAETMGFGRADGKYATFLRGRYGDAATLNEAYGTSFADFAEAMPVEQTDGSPEQTRRVKDYLDFYLTTIADYCEALTGMLREGGIDVPIIHNSANPVMNALFEPTVRRMGNTSFLLGSDHYYNLEGQNNPTPEYAVKAFYSCEMLRLWGFPPTVFELPSGQNFDYPPVLVEDELACYWANVALGMKGHNYYIYTGGPNPPDTGTTADVYDFNAPIGANGEIRPLYEAQKQFGVYLAENAWLMEAERECDFRVALDFEHARSPYYLKQGGKTLFTHVQAWELLRKGLLTSAFSGSLSPVLCDLGSDEWLADTSTPVAVVASASMARADQQRLVRFLQAGGRVMILPILPSLDEKLQPCTVLADFLGGPVSRRPGPGHMRLAVGEPPAIVYRADAFVTENLPAAAKTVGVDAYSGRPLAWSLDTAGGGRAVVLGLRWNHARHDNAQALRNSLAPLGLEQKVTCDNPNVWTSLRTAGRRSVLFLMNLYSGKLSAEVTCQPAWANKTIDTGRHELEAMSVKLVELA